MLKEVQKISVSWSRLSSRNLQFRTVMLSPSNLDILFTTERVLRSESRLRLDIQIIDHLGLTTSEKKGCVLFSRRTVCVHSTTVIMFLLYLSEKMVPLIFSKSVFLEGPLQRYSLRRMGNPISVDPCLEEGNLLGSTQNPSTPLITPPRPSG